MSASFFSIKDPFEQFNKYFSQASATIKKDPNAFQLATLDSSGQVSVRTLLYKGVVRDGFSFYTNYDSRKAQAMLANPKIAMNFYWPELDMQIRIEGLVEKLTRQESESYFSTRPRLSQIGAWASKQSREIPNIEYLEKIVADLDAKYAGKVVPCPENWGGFHLKPLRMEFWFSKVGRLHERYVYSRETLDSSWKTSMLSP